MVRVAAFLALPALAVSACAGEDQAAQTEIQALTFQLQSAQDAQAVAEAARMAAESRARAAELELAGAQESIANADAAPSLTEGLAAAPDARATLLGGDGAAVGEALFWAGPQGIVIRLAAEGLTPGYHGMHVHAVGACEAGDGFASAGAHTGAAAGPHGLLNPDGPHAGNLPNLVVSPSGRAATEIYTTLATMDDGPAGLFDADGAALIIHAEPDDHVSQPIGGSGARAACGVVTRAEAP